MDGCPACRNVMDGKKAGRARVAKCMRRYALWLRTTLSAEGATSGVGVQQQPGSTELIPPASSRVRQPEPPPVSVNQPVSRKRSQAEDEDDIDVSRLWLRILLLLLLLYHKAHLRRSCLRQRVCLQQIHLARSLTCQLVRVDRC